MMRRSVNKLIESAYKTNSFLEWALNKPEKERIHYMDISVTLDMILQTKEPYYG